MKKTFALLVAVLMVVVAGLIFNQAKVNLRGDLGTPACHGHPITGRCVDGDQCPTGTHCAGQGSTCGCVSDKKDVCAGKRCADFTNGNVCDPRPCQDLSAPGGDGMCFTCGAVPACKDGDPCGPPNDPTCGHYVYCSTTPACDTSGCNFMSSSYSPPPPPPSPVVPPPTSPEPKECGGIVPMCNGQCPEGKACGASATDLDGNAVQCSCEDDTPVACGDTLPECGGDCPDGKICTATAYKKDGTATMCGCVKEATATISQ